MIPVRFYQLQHIIVTPDHLGILCLCPELSHLHTVVGAIVQSESDHVIGL
jgi:hypothetical protein